MKLGVGPKAEKCKGPEAGKSLVDLRAGKKAAVAGDGDRGGGGDWKVGQRRLRGRGRAGRGGGV